MQKFSPSILSLNLIPLGDLSGPLKGAFSQEEINSGFFFLFFVIFCTKVMVSKWSAPYSSSIGSCGTHCMVVAFANDCEASLNSEQIGANCRRNISPTSTQSDNCALLNCHCSRLQYGYRRPLCSLHAAGLSCSKRLLMLFNNSEIWFKWVINFSFGEWGACRWQDP